MVDGRHLGFCIYIIFGLMKKLLFTKSILPQIWCRSVKLFGIKPLARISRWWTVAVLDFVFHHFQSHVKASVHKTSLASKFDEDRLNGLEVRAIFSKFKMADGRHLGFCIYIIFSLMKKLLFIKSVLPQYFVQIGEMVWKLKPISRNSRQWPVAILDFVFTVSCLAKSCCTKISFPSKWPAYR